MRNLFLVIISGMITTVFAADHNPHALFTELLQNYVKNGEVNYDEMRGDDRLQIYISSLQSTNPDTIENRSTQLAFWLNAYNAFTLQVIVDNYPVESINDLHWGGLYIGTVLNKTIWDKKFITIARESYSLNDIEHEIVRKRYDDARIHFALVCASKSCPSLRAEAYTGNKLETQLDDQARNFFAREDINRFDITGKTAHLSKIIDWYESDFGENDDEILMFVSQFIPEKIASVIRRDPESWQIKYTGYDWSLNGY